MKRIVISLIGLAVSALVSGAQTVDSTRVRRQWFNHREVNAAGFAVLGTIALAPLDRRLSDELQKPRWQSEDGLRQYAGVLAFLGGPGPFVIGSALIMGGFATRELPMMAAGRRVTESVLLAATITAVAKGVAGRALPGVETEHEFSLGRGFHDANGPFVSFPSGHTAAGFALATALADEVGRAQPRLLSGARVIAYTTATSIGVARVYQHVHWPSDLPVAAAIGMWSGSTVERWADRRTPRAMHRLLDGVTVVPRGTCGLTIAWSSLLSAATRPR